MGTSSSEEECNNPISPQMETSSNGSHPHHTDPHTQHQYYHDDEDQNQSPDDENENENETRHSHPIVDKLERLNFADEQNENDVKFHNYPLRPYAMDCSFYIKTGSCKFGESCRFNHPLERVIQVDGDKEKIGFDSNGLGPGLAKFDCKYFSTPGGCKYGDSCRYNHSTENIDAHGVELNFVGLPIRPWEKQCDFYMRNGTCKYGGNCRYHHPDPSSAKEFDGNSLANGSSLRGDSGFHRSYQPPRSSGAFQGSLSQKTNSMNLKNYVPYAANMSPYHQGVLQNPGWIQNQVTVPLPPHMGPLPHQMMNNFSNTSNPQTHYDPGIQSDEFPVRPGQPNCDYFMKTGDCKYRSACRYNHPGSQTPNMQLQSPSTMGSYPRPGTSLPGQSTELPSLKPNYTRKNGVPYNQQIQNEEFPERPGQPECEYFMKTGNCKFRSACRYHHPKNRVSISSPIAASDKGLPLRPGSRICRNYEQLGTCKYGMKCLFHHPDDSYSVGQVAPIAAPQDNTLTDAQVTSNDSELPKSRNDAQDWDDGWAT